MLDQIGADLKAKGITLEDLMASGREIRGEILREKYGIDSGDKAQRGSSGKIEEEIISVLLAQGE